MTLKLTIISLMTDYSDMKWGHVEEVSPYAQKTHIS